MLLLGMVACADEAPVATKQPAVKATEQVALDVYKSPTCECCGRWASHIDAKGFAATTHHPADLNLVKQKLGIQAPYHSCQTSESTDAYDFE